MSDPRFNIGPMTIQSVLRLWREQVDTQTIALRMKMRQRTVCRIIAADQDRRYAERQAARTAEAAHA